MKLKTLLFLLPVSFAMILPAAALQINWGSQVDSIFRDSLGQPLDNTFQVQLGYFQNVLGSTEAFVPSQSNIGQWSTQWVTFDQAAFSPADGYFTSKVLMDENGHSSYLTPNNLGVDFSNQTAYVWIKNSQTPGTGTEWFIGRKNADQNSAGWATPDKVDECCDTRTVEWSVTDLNSADRPVYGRQGTMIGDGDYTTTSPSYNLQTFSVVPEPTAHLLFATGAVMLLLKRRRDPA